jgi:hypothetical protein
MSLYICDVLRGWACIGIRISPALAGAISCASNVGEIYRSSYYEYADTSAVLETGLEDAGVRRACVTYHIHYRALVSPTAL